MLGKLHWVVRQDVDNFFDTLDHDRMLTLFNGLVNNDQRLVGAGRPLEACCSVSEKIRSRQAG